MQAADFYSFFKKFKKGCGGDLSTLVGLVA
jgi:hypothetical protein